MKLPELPRPKSLTRLALIAALSGASACATARKEKSRPVARVTGDCEQIEEIERTKGRKVYEMCGRIFVETEIGTIEIPPDSTHNGKKNINEPSKEPKKID